MSNDTSVTINPEEFAVAQVEAAASPEAITIRLRKPFTYEGRTFEELTFDWNKLTGNDSLAIEGEMQAMSIPLITPTFSGEYLVRMAARSCTETIDQLLLRALPIADFNKVRNAARSFLLKTES